MGGRRGGKDERQRRKFEEKQGRWERRKRCKEVDNLEEGGMDGRKRGRGGKE